jgi:hypothetical protein
MQYDGSGKDWQDHARATFLHEVALLRKGVAACSLDQWSLINGR